VAPRPNIRDMPARGALTLFRVRGIRIGLDYSWFLVVLLVIVWLSGQYRDTLGPRSSDFEAYLLAVVSALCFFGSILLHELGHAFVALRHGIGISDITLWMFGGVARMTRDSDSPATELKVAIAGPAVTLLIALVCAGIGLLEAGQGFWDAMPFKLHAHGSGPTLVLAWLAAINAFILVFNLIPAFPLDGGRIARAVAWWRTGNRTTATRFAAGLGQGFSYALMGLGLLLLIQGQAIDGIWLGVLGFMLNASARSAVVQTELSSRIEHLRVADVMDSEPVAIPEDLSVERALDEYFLRYQWPWFPVVDTAQRFVGLINRVAADAVPEPSRVSSLVSGLIEERDSSGLRVPVEAPLESVLGNDDLRRLGALAAVDPDGRLRGIVTVDQIGRALRNAVVPVAGAGEA
jgi:Zn-dependent protease